MRCSVKKISAVTKTGLAHHVSAAAVLLQLEGQSSFNLDSFSLFDIIHPISALLIQQCSNWKVSHILLAKLF